MEKTALLEKRKQEIKLLTDERWAKGYEGLVSCNPRGDVFAYSRRTYNKKKLKPQKNGSAGIRWQGERIHINIGRVLWETWRGAIPKGHNVSRRNGSASYHIDNLRTLSQKELMAETMRQRNAKEIHLYSFPGFKWLDSFKNAQQAADFLGYEKAHIHAILSPNSITRANQNELHSRGYHISYRPNLTTRPRIRTERGET